MLINNLVHSYTIYKIIDKNQINILFYVRLDLKIYM